MKHFKIIIIGAGASGIAAASRLLKNGIADLTILEAENRIGGRIYTTKFGDNIAEIGAQWVHGQKRNVVHELADKHSLIYDSESHFEESSFFTSSGKQISPEVCKKFHALYWSIMEEAEDGLRGYSGSLGEYFTLKFMERMKDVSMAADVSNEVRDQFLSWFHKVENSIDASDDWFETSGKGHVEYWDCEGNLLMAWKTPGYQALFNLLMRKEPQSPLELPVRDKVMVNKVVTRVSWQESPQAGQPNVRVECADGTVLSADHVVVTVSLGVLKEKAAALFQPSLPLEKLTAIKALGFGTVDKLFLKFPTRWWTEDPDGFSFLWSKEEDGDVTGWESGVFGFHPDSYQPTVLLGWVVGPAAHRMERCSDQQVLDTCMAIFRRFLGAKYPNMPRAEAVLRSRWHSNPHFRGSYSCRLVESDRTDAWATHLEKPIVNSRGMPVVLFGGEATHPHFFSTVHGAVESGWREAERLTEAIRVNSLQTKNVIHKYEVVIVGGGVSGLAAAKTLLDNGVTDFVVLEAQSEAGGRVKSLPLDGRTYLELGAQWLHGERNAVYEISKTNGLLSEAVSQEGEGLYLQEDGAMVDPTIVGRVADAVKDILEDCETLVSREDPHPISSIGEEMAAGFERYLNSASDTDEAKLLKKDLFRWHERFQVIDNACADLRRLSANSWGLYRFCGGRDYVNFKQGYSSLIDVLTALLPPKCLVLNQPVRRIAWGAMNEVACDDATYHADHVIVTCSLGYLKQHYRTMFLPELPCYLSQAIDLLGFGLLNKIFLVYESPWWEDDVKGFQLVWSEGAETEGGACSWGRDLTGFDVLQSERPVLLGWIGGRGAEIVETMTEEQLSEEATEILRRFTMNPRIPRPSSVARSQWLSNDFIKGGYSHTTVECDRSSLRCSQLARPVVTSVEESGVVRQKPAVLLAGEAAHESHFSTVHGAFESGVSQAEVLIQYRNAATNVQ